MPSGWQEQQTCDHHQNHEHGDVICDIADP
jgi:hypothetical protein